MQYQSFLLFLLLYKNSKNCIISLKKTSGFATTHVVVSVKHNITANITVRRIQMFFSLKPSQSQGESSLKISARWGSPFRRS